MRAPHSTYVPSFIRSAFFQVGLINLTLCALCALCALCFASFGCSDEEYFQEPIPFSEETITLRVENVSQFDYEALYAHMSPGLNMSEARKLNTTMIPSKTFTEIIWPRGAYLTAVRRLVVRGPRVAIRSESALSPREGARLLRLLDEGFVLVDTSEEPAL